jgi:hypothetical protein
MTRRTLVARQLAPLISSLLLTSVALAAPTLPGINARWDACLADGGVMNKNFACDTNTGLEQIVLSVQLDGSMPDVSGMEIRVSLKGSTPALPAWWDFFMAGSCRQTSLSFVSDPSPVLPPGSCVDWNEGKNGAGGIGAYRVDEIGPGSRVLLIASAVPQSTLALLDPGTEYRVGLLRINHTKTVGTGACGGCDTPVCILFTSLKVTTPVAANDRLFTQGANGVSSQIVNWQNGQLLNLVNHCTGTFDCNTQFDCAGVGAVASRHSTWGAVKSLYR